MQLKVQSKEQVKVKYRVQSGHYQNEAIQYFNKVNTDTSLRTNIPKLESEGLGGAANGLMDVVPQLLLLERKSSATRVNIGMVINR